jgi:nitrogen fixation NifU-like protein
MTEQTEPTDLDRWVAAIQREILERERALYSARVVEEARNPKNLKRMDRPDAHAIVRGWCGDAIEIYLQLDGERIQQTTFVTDGCGPTVACGSVLTTMMQDLTLEEACEIKPNDLLSVLDGLPEEYAHCAELAVNTLRAAIADHQREGGTGHE